MCSKLTLIIIICLTNYIKIIIEADANKKFRLCVVEQQFNMKQINNICAQFTDYDPIECVFESDRLSCMRDLSDSTVDFAVFQPEDLVVYSNIYSNSHILITHELRLLYNDTSSFEMIALVSKDIHSLSDLKGKKFCHPGYNLQSSEWTRIFANFFQSWITPKKCAQDETLIENEFSSLSEYFYSACIAGLWIPDTNENHKLKIRYKNLHKLCDNRNDYNIDDIYYGREGAIRCLIDGVGDIAWARLADAQQYFKRFHMKNSSYNYICPDGLARPVNSSDPCVWISKPWPVIGARKDYAEIIFDLINKKNNELLPWYKYLMRAMEFYHITPVALDTLKTPEDYLHQFNGFSSANMRATCRPSRNIKWCVASTIDNEKCQWMRNVAIAHGIEPTIICHQFNERNACIDAVKNGHSELFIVNTDEINKAYENNLSALVQIMPKEITDLNTFGILVKKNSNLWNLDDLRNTRGCFPSDQGLEWKTFVSVMRSQMLLKESNTQMDVMWNCSDDKAMKYFFNEIITFNDEMDNGKNPIESTYNCLISGRGDAAFVNLNNYNKINYNKLQYKLRNICVNKMESEKFNECILTWTPLAVAMVNVNMTELRRIEIQTMLSLLDESFGYKLYDSNPRSFLLYGSFNHKDNIIFPMKAHYLQHISDTSQLPRNYLNILEQIGNSREELSICNNANSYLTMNMTFVLISIVIIMNFVINNSMTVIHMRILIN